MKGAPTMKEKKGYTEPILTVTSFKDSDVIATSLIIPTLGEPDKNGGGWTGS